MIPTAKDLEELGCEVRISHFRPAPGLNPRRLFSRFDLRRLGAQGSAFAAKGGLTLAAIILPDGSAFASAAFCSKRDNFCRARGREIALGRAWDEAQTAYLNGALAL